MSDQSERIRAALLRFKAAPPEPESASRPPVVVNEQNLAALFLPSVGRTFPVSPVRKLAATKGS
jgi:hypothetical protein